MSNISINGQSFENTPILSKTLQASAPAPEASSARTDEELREVSAPGVIAAPILTPQSQQTIKEMILKNNWGNASMRNKFSDFAETFIKRHGAKSLEALLLKSKDTLVREMLDAATKNNP